VPIFNFIGLCMKTLRNFSKNLNFSTQKLRPIEKFQTLCLIFVAAVAAEEENFQFVSDYSFFPPTHKSRRQQVIPAGVFPACCVESSFIIRECFSSLLLNFDEIR
jgi:hypothetical protein